jgi:heme/copper-type cytochrome/quinol oxidase subunit 2
MFKKKSILIGLVLSVLLIISACSSDKTSQTNKEETPVKTSIALSGDTVSEKGGCVLASRYKAGDKIIFRMNAIDPSTNKQIEEAKLTVHLATGEKLDMKYGKHGDDHFWVVAYPVTAETPTGSFEYYVTAEAGEAKAEFRPFNVAPSLISIVDEEAVTGEEAPKEEPKAEETAKAQPNQNVEIIATDFEFDKKEYVVKAGEEITVTLTSEKGSHGIDIQGMNKTIKAPNGKVTFTPDKPGEYPIVCNVFCGAGHGEMTAKLIVVE